MKDNFNKHILEAVNKGIKLALDDYENDSIADIGSSKNEIIKNDEEIFHRIQDVVDLGLPSKTQWAKYNVGVNSGKLNTYEDWYGKYFAWGEIEEKEIYNWETYIWGGPEKTYNWNEYILKYGKYEDTELELRDDAAYMNTRGIFIMPNDEQFNELIKYCNIEYIIPKDGIKYDGHQLYTNGYMFTSKINGEKLFFPCADIKSDTETTNYNLHQNNANIAYYWSRSLYDCGDGCKLTDSLHLYFNHGKMHSFVSGFDRAAGLPIRGVLNKK